MFTFSLNTKTKEGRELVTSFSMSVNQHDRIALIGEEGNGKSVFLKSLIQHPDVMDLEIQRSISQPNLVFGYVSQDVSLGDLDLSVLEFALNNQWDRYAVFLKLFHKLLPNLTEEDFDRTLATLSGGERVKLQLVKLMLEDVDVYVLDEPTNNLDVDTLQWLEAWMLEQDAPILFVSHDVTLITHTANRIIHFELLNKKTTQQITLFEGSYADYWDIRQRKIAHHNQIVASQEREHKRQLDTWQQQYQKVGHQLQNVNRADPGLQKKMKNLKAQKARYDKQPPIEQRTVESPSTFVLDTLAPISQRHLVDVDVSHPMIAVPIHFSMTSTSKIACTGSNGIGKSTFINLWTESLATSSIAYQVVYQDIWKNLDLSLSPLDHCAPSGMREALESTRNALSHLRFSREEMTLPLHKLSGGQRTKVSLLHAMNQSPQLLILDEPTRNLSPDTQKEVTEMLEAFPGAIFCITHDRGLMAAIFDTCFTLTSEGLTSSSTNF